MANYKQIDMRFWQNDFVLGLTPVEKFFYMYLITNTMTTKCGIYKFNMKVAELETGYTAEVIDKLLVTFENYGKIAVSKTTSEIMILHWFKHNFKNNKKTILEINKELKDVKDKEFIRKLYDICLERDYPVKDLFCGIISSVDEEKVIEKPVKVLFDANDPRERDIIEETMIESVGRVETAEVAESVESVESAEIVKGTSPPLQFIVQQLPSEELMDECEELVVETEEEDEDDDILEGTVIASWGFFEGAGEGTPP